MKDNRIQVILPDELVEKFAKEAEKQNRSHSNLARLYIVDGLKKDEAKSAGVPASILGVNQTKA